VAVLVAVAEGSSKVRIPLLIYDGDCGFCRRWIKHWKSITRDQVEYAPYQTVAIKYPHIDYAEFEKAVHFIEPDGTVTKGAEAVFRTLKHSPFSNKTRYPLWLYQNIPGVKSASQAAYWIVAKNRRFFSKILP